MLKPRSSSRRAFTLVELLVVVAVIALLIGILVPALGGARKEAQRLTITNNLRSIATAVNSYSATAQVLPPSYVYGSKLTGGSWRMQEQLDDNPNENNGYIHWSYAVVGEDTTETEAFESPLTTNGGAPRTNPGPKAEDWETSWQRDDTSSTTPQANPTDRQARRVAFGGNHLLFPRNKFLEPGLAGAGTSRKNVLVNPAIVKAPSRTILATEYLDRENWRSLEDPDELGECKSHRPITPVIGTSSGADVFKQSNSKKANFIYPALKNILRYDQLGKSMMDDPNAGDLNAISREHPGGDKDFGGLSHFVFLDGHVEKLSVRDTIANQLWGDRFYAISGTNTKIYANPADD